jgi:hypothetical protein
VPGRERTKGKEKRGVTGNELFALFGSAVVVVLGAWALVKVVAARFDRRVSQRVAEMEKACGECRKKLDIIRLGRRRTTR